MATIMVIDDEESVRKVVGRRLKQEGHRVITARDAAPALVKTDFNTIDLIILDLLMDTPGDIAIQTIRSRGFQLPIVILSGKLKAGDEARLLELGADKVLKKPFRLKGMIGVIDQLLRGQA